MFLLGQLRPVPGFVVIAGAALALFVHALVGEDLMEPPGELVGVEVADDFG